MAKRPVPGRTKTRLCPPFSPEAAALIYECFLQDTLDIARSIPEVTRFIAGTPSCQEAYFRQLAADFALMPQVGDSLSERLDGVLTSCSNAGFAQVIAINSDSPTLPGQHIRQAFAQLDQAQTDVVFGPATDGGYYLIGWKQPNGRLVRQVEMSTQQVLEDSLRIARKEALNVVLVPTWYDVDDAGDLPRLRADLATSPAAGKHTRQFLERVEPGKATYAPAAP